MKTSWSTCPQQGSGPDACVRSSSEQDPAVPGVEAGARSGALWQSPRRGSRSLRVKSFARDALARAEFSSVSQFPEHPKIPGHGGEELPAKPVRLLRGFREAGRGGKPVEGLAASEGQGRTLGPRRLPGVRRRGSRCPSVPRRRTTPCASQGRRGDERERGPRQSPCAALGKY